MAAAQVTSNQVTPEWAMAVNRLFWEEVVPHHVAGRFYDVAGFCAGRCTLKPTELAELGDVAGLKVLHLQCHFGLDSLSLARRGAAVTGLDYAGAAVDAARRLSRETGLAAEFVEANVYDAPAALNATFDLVYTAWGVLSWLPDLPAWARVVGRVLRPGGRLYLADAHPVMHLFDDDAAAEAPLRVRYDYRGDGRPELYDDPGTYADRSAPIRNTREYFHRYTLDAVVNALLAAGLVLDRLNEHDSLCWQGLPQLVEGADGLWRLPPGAPRIPLSFSIAAHRPDD